ncbi:hypothetical protein ABT381_33430, partial [Streptomyces sp. NPDC000151]|uniref:hypothetical protein n=1 Tax=Streptomyces sp. NPDC000151 TaxID=3154244 RepID=UPI00332F7084
MRDRAGRPTAPQSWADVVAALRGAGLDPDAGELADALWLAQWCRPRGAVAEQEDGGGTAEAEGRVPGARTPALPRTAARQDGPGADREPPGGRSAGPPGTTHVALYPAGQELPG